MDYSFSESEFWFGGGVWVLGAGLSFIPREAIQPAPRSAPPIKPPTAVAIGLMKPWGADTGA